MLTTAVFNYLTDASAYLNKHLFENKLPVALITLSRRKGAYGYFFAGAFVNSGNDCDEIALTPTSISRSTLESLSTLTHELVHQWQHHFGNPGENAYHNKEWANKMLSVGLKPYCVTNDKLMTGYKCSHDIVEDGPFDKVAKKFIELHGDLPIATQLDLTIKLIRHKHRPQMMCPQCKIKMAVPINFNISIVCNTCNKEMISLDARFRHYSKIERNS